MKKIIVLLSCVLPFLCSCSDKEVMDVTMSEADSNQLLTLTNEQGQPVTMADALCTTYYAHIHTDGDWSLTSTVPYIVPVTECGTGDAVVKVIVGNNWQGEREGQLILTQTGDTRAAGSTVTRANIKQTANSTLDVISGVFSSNKGAGFSYLPNTNYCLGANMELFNLCQLDELQQSANYNFIVDDLYPGVVEEVIIADSQEELQNKLAISASLSVDFRQVAVKVSGSYENGSTTDNSRTYAMKRLKAYNYTREINYMNIVAVAQKNEALRDRLYAPGFYMYLENFIDRINSLASQSNDTTLTNPICREFLQVCGPCFISKSVMGCTLDYELSVKKSILNEDFTVAGALDVALMMNGVKIKVNGEGKYEDYKKTVSQNTDSKVVIRGGDVNKVNILATDGKIENDQILLWQQSVEPSNCVMIDMELIPIYAVVFDKKAHDVLKTYFDFILAQK